jgi:hypothetical protein
LAFHFQLLILYHAEVYSSYNLSKILFGAS